MKDIFLTTNLWKPTKWEKVILFFLPMRVSQDEGFEPWKLPVRLYYKKWRGRIYVLKEERIKQPKN